MTRRTPLYAAHVRADARLVDFAGWLMPVQYKATGVLAEHAAVRERAGLFDVSHMGRLSFRGPDAAAMVNRLITNDVGSLPDGKAQYTAICHDNGGILDDAISYRFASDEVMMVVNASNKDKIVAWFRERATGDAEWRDVSDELALIAIQGPRAHTVTDRLFDGAATMQPFEVRRFGDAVLATTGYTGEPGFEIFVPTERAEAVWDALLDAGRPEGLVPAGLGARDTLRLELKLCLYGNDIDESTNPIEAGLSWVCKLDKPGGFIGCEALRAVKANGTTRRLVGLEMVERGIARHGYPVLDSAGREIGRVSSGTKSPSTGAAIAMAWVDKPHHKRGTSVRVQIRSRQVGARIVKTPFYRRQEAS